MNWPVGTEVGHDLMSDTVGFKRGEKRSLLDARLRRKIVDICRCRWQGRGNSHPTAQAAGDGVPQGSTDHSEPGASVFMFETPRSLNSNLSNPSENTAQQWNPDKPCP